VILGLPGLSLALLIIPGKEVNRYGNPPPSIRSQRFTAAIMVFLTIVAWSAFYLYIFRPAFQAYETRNAISGGVWGKITGESPIAQFTFASPNSGSITLNTGQNVPMTYRARYRTLYLSFSLNDNQYLEQLQYNIKSNQLEMMEGDAIVGIYERR
jgi:hypothetical protein